MPLSTGDRIGHCEILAPIGAGGMGEVYRARDTKLKRDVALKVLPEAFGADPERMARFQREAEVLASLNHPNIAAIYGVEDRALIMELVEGESPKGPLSFDEAWRVASQIAAALEYAHDRGIVHRDLKPANIKITPDGTLKLLDFGLAKAFTTRPDKPVDAENSPTITMGATEVGVILGTAAYMSPEQAKGKSVDKRADIWAFGVVLYELLTGERLFKGEDLSETLAQVLTKEPDLGKVPFKVRKLLRRCLERDPKKRLRDIGDAADLLDDAPSRTAPSPSRLGLVAAALAVVSVVLGGLYWRATRPVERPLMRLSVDLGPDAVGAAVISPDGSRLVFPVKSGDGKQMLATRSLSETKPLLLSGTENGRDAFFSPDGKWIGFFADGKMKKISVQGGAPVVLCDAPAPRGADWGEGGSITVALNVVGAISRVPAAGGAPHPVTKLQGDAFTHRWPQILPGDETVLFTLSSTTATFEDASIAVVSLKTGETKILVRGGYFGRYLQTGDATGHLVYVHEGVLFGAPFDPAKRELRGTAVPISEDLEGDPNSGAGQFGFSNTGNFVYRAGKVSAQSWPVSWLDNSGKTQPLIITPGFFASPRFSPDGQRVALSQIAGSNQGIFVYDWRRDTMSRLTPETQQTRFPTWTPDGKHIVFGFRSADGFGLGWIRADGAGETQHLLNGRSLMNPYSFFPDGDRLAYFELDSDTGFDLWTLPLDVSDPDHPKPGKPELFLRTPSNERFPAVSPDGHWIAYQSDESGETEVYVRPFPGPGGKWQISSAGGQLPVWLPNGRELFFENLDDRIMVTDYELKNESFVPGKPRVWSDQRLHDIGGGLNYDLAPDGKRFAIVPEMKTPTEEKGNVHETFLENFFDELRRRAPASGK
ncbi:MAG: protein kinase [Bryobacteraceae bacterium]|jgi:serine/threonine-protein kinase